MAIYKRRCVITVYSIYIYIYIYMGMVVTARDCSRSSRLFSLLSYPTLTRDGMVIIQHRLYSVKYILVLVI